MGYIATQIAGGWLAQKFGGKIAFGLSMLLCGIVTSIMPLAATADYRILMGLRVVLGICQGVVWPAMGVLWTRWAPREERGTLAAICYAGSQIGIVISFPISALLCEYAPYGGWPFVFYVFAALSVIWSISWMFIVYDSPDVHPRISEDERLYISNSVRKDSIDTELDSNKSVPWLKILTSLPVWAMFVTNICATFGTDLFITNMPTYMREVLLFDVKTIGFLSFLPYIGSTLVIYISGIIFDAIVNHDIMSKKVARRICNTVSLMGSGLFLFGLVFVDCSEPYAAVALLFLTVSFTGAQIGAGFIAYPSDIAPRFSGIILAISNSLATVSGFLSPLAVGIMTKNQTQQEWQTVFYLCTGLFTLGSLFFVFFSSGTIQQWAIDPNIEVERSEVNAKRSSLFLLSKTVSMVTFPDSRNQEKI